MYLTWNYLNRVPNFACAHRSGSFTNTNMVSSTALIDMVLMTRVSGV